MNEEQRKIRAFDWLEAQTKESRTGVSLDFHRDGGYRFMRNHYFGDSKRNLLEAIEDVMIKDAGREKLGLNDR